MKFTRRTMLTGSAALACGVAAPSLFAAPAHADEMEFDRIRLQFVAGMIGPDVPIEGDELVLALETMDAGVDRLIAQLVSGPDRTQVFTNLPLVDQDYTGNMQTTGLQLSSMARAWGRAGSRHHHNEDLAAAIVDGLRTLHDHAYHAGATRYGNWYHWEIGTPRGMLEAAAVTFDELPADLVDDICAAVRFWIPHPASNNPSVPDPEDDPNGNFGANLLQMCMITIVGGALSNDAARVALGRDAVLVSFDVVDSGDGLYLDGSYLYHASTAYNGTYGAELLTYGALVVPMLAGTAWAIDRTVIAPFLDKVELAFVHWAHRGTMVPTVMGRAVGRGRITSYNLIDGLLALAEGSTDQTALRWQAVVKGWLQEDTADNYFAQATLAQGLRAAMLLSADLPAAEVDSGVLQCTVMDRVTMRGPGWCLPLATSSTRTRRFENMSNENMRAWYQGSGTRYLLTDSDQLHYNEWFCVVDPYRMPGTTIEKVPAPVATTVNGAHRFVGGTSLGPVHPETAPYGSHQFGSWVHQETGPIVPTMARLSWFMLGDRLVCLGAGITTSGSGAAVESILENRAVTAASSGVWYFDGEPDPESEEPGHSTTRTVRSFGLSGVASYVFLEPTDVEFLHETRTGRRSDTSEAASSTPYTYDFMTAWLDHGPTPTDDSYAYLVLPGVDPEDAAAMADDPGVAIVANRPELQAVSSPEHGVLGANFHERGRVSADGVSIIAPREVSVTVRRLDSRVAVAVSDPTQTQDSVTVQVRVPPGRGWTLERGDSTVSTTVDRGTIILTVTTRGTRGRSHRAEFRAR